MLLSPLKISPTARFGLGGAFNIANSFYLDGVNEYFTIPNASLINTIAGTNKQFTLNFVFKRQNIGVLQHLIANYTSGTDFSIYVAISTVNKLQFTIYDGVLARNLITNETITNQQIWYHVTIKYDGVTPSNSKIIINGVDSTYSSNTLTSTIFNSSTIFKIGNALTYYMNVYFQSMYLVDRIVTDEENTNHYNNGKPKNPQSLFGTNCKFFFNSDNSGDTAQFSVVDSVNSITATSVNMEDADKTPLTPYTDPLQAIIDKYATLNAWSFENFGINGTTSTIYDYEGTHDLSNPAVANQPTFIGGDANINNRPSAYFVTDDYLYKATANYLSGQSTGSVHMVFTTNADVTTNSFIFSSNDTASANYIFDFYYGSGKIRGRIRDTNATERRYDFTCDTTTILANTSYVVSVYQNGTTLQVLINGVAQSLTITNGTAETYWFANISNRDNISIGATIYSSAGYSDIDIALVQITSDSADSTVLANHNELKTLYGI